MNFLYTFRGRLLLILALLLIATLGIQYYLNLVTQRENIDLREAQTRALVAGVALGSNGITSSDYMSDIVDRDGQTFFDRDARKRIKDVIIIDNKWQIRDSLDPQLAPRMENGTAVYRKLSELTDLPRLIEADRLGPDIASFPNHGVGSDISDDEAHAIPVNTTTDGRWYIIVLLKNDRSQAAWQAARPLVYTLGILLVSSLITFLLVWRFTAPITDLSDAARRVANGDLSVRVRTGRRNELGILAGNFNEMTAELERKRNIETQLQQAEKSAVVGRLGSAIAHEIRNPLNYINLTLDHLRNKYAPAEPDKNAEFQKLTSQLKGEVARINRQISDFLAYSRPVNADLKPIKARDAIAESLRLIGPQADENNVTVGVIEHEGVPNILGDVEFLRSVFNNLLVNAVQAIGNNGGHISIKISAEDQSRFVDFEVADNGPGIAKEDIAKIFEPYFSTKETGTGLGLAIAQKVVEMHGGTIEVEQAESGGTKFIVRLLKENQSKN